MSASWQKEKRKKNARKSGFQGFSTFNVKMSIHVGWLLDYLLENAYQVPDIYFMELIALSKET